MAGIAKDPFELDQRPGSTKWRVRFSHKGRRYAFSTGETDKGKAREEGRKKYRETIEGRVAEQGGVSVELFTAISNWKEALPGLVGPLTAKEYGFVGDKWPERGWKYVHDIDTQAIAEWGLDRLKEATRETLRKNRAALRNFLNFCETKKWLATVPAFPALPRGLGTRVVPDKTRIPIAPADVERLLKQLPDELREYYTVLWDTGWRPATVNRLDARAHSPCKGPGGAGLGVWVTPDVEKSRNATRGKKGKKAWVPVPPRVGKILGAKTGLMFGEDDRRADKLKAYALQILGREVTEYDFKHSRITAWFRAGKDPLGISYMTGVALDTLIKHYAHPGEEAARTLF